MCSDKIIRNFIFKRETREYLKNNDLDQLLFITIITFRLYFVDHGL